MCFSRLSRGAGVRLAFAPLLLLLVAGGVAAQDADPGGFPDVSLGFKGGLGITQHQGVEPRDLEYTVSSSMRRCLAAGAFLELPITSRFSLQYEFLYVQKGSRQKIGVEIFDIPTVLDVTYDLDYLEIPVLLRYQWVKDRAVDFYSMAGFAFALRVDSRYQLSGTVDDGTETIPLHADADMSEVDLFDFLFTYGLGIELPVGRRRLLLEYRFDLSVPFLSMPTYAEVPFGDEVVLVNNEPVPLRNQAHMIMIGIRF